MFDRDSEMMNIINRNIPYKEKREIINIMTESEGMKEKTYFNIANYFYGKTFEKIGNTKLEEEYIKSNGSITKSKFFDSTSETLDLLLANSPQYNKDTLVVKNALDNLKYRSKSFEVAFKADAKLSKMVYGVISKACVKTTSMILTDSLNGRSNNDISSIAIGSLDIFNRCCSNGTVDKMLRYDTNLGGRAVKEGIFDDAINFGISAASAMITGLRRMVYWVYYSRIDLADYLEQQAAYIELNKIRIENRKDLSDAKKKEILKKQTEWSKKLLELSDKIQVDDIKAARKAKADAEKDEKNIKSNDVHPSTGSSSSNDPMPDFF